MVPTCAQTSPGLVASLMPRQRAAGRGGGHLSGPTGGAAYGMPRNSLAPPACVPWTNPLSVRTTSGADRVPAAAAVDSAADATRMAMAEYVSLRMADSPSLLLTGK